jgi:SAM-dependent methyltransferase
MTMQVLQNKLQIQNARREMVTRHLSCMESSWSGLLRRLRLKRGLLLGDYVKSWDVLSTLNYLEKRLQKSDTVLDIGSYASEVIVSLHKLGFTNLTGSDLNPALKEMPYADAIRYEITNFMQTPFADASFKAITSISVIEHGFDGAALLKEISRLLKPGGYFVSSFDYWPEKLDTTGIKFFGMDWLIFSKQDVQDFIRLAFDYGLKPAGDLHFEGGETPIDCAGKKYTFGWLVLQKAT